MDMDDGAGETVILALDSTTYEIGPGGMRHVGNTLDRGWIADERELIGQLPGGKKTFYNREAAVDVLVHVSAGTGPTLVGNPEGGDDCPGKH